MRGQQNIKSLIYAYGCLACSWRWHESRDIDIVNKRNLFTNKVSLT